MRVSIIAVDNVVSIDGETHCASCEELIAQDIHAVQWHEDHGEIGFRPTGWPARSDGTESRMI